MGEPHSAVEIELVCPQGHERFECSFAYGIASDGRREIARKPVLRGSYRVDVAPPFLFSVFKAERHRDWTRP